MKKEFRVGFSWLVSVVAILSLLSSSYAAPLLVAAGRNFTIAQAASASFWGWGDNGYGQLGNGATIGSNTPIPILGLSGTAFISIAAGSASSLGSRPNGAWGWGGNASGQLGDGTTVNVSTAGLVLGASGVNVTKVSTGEAHSVALEGGGTMWGWGDNTYGQLGDGTTTSSTIPVTVTALSRVTSISAGGYHTLALDQDGRVWGWGNNAFGQVGDGTLVNSPVPVPVLGLSGVRAISAGFSHSLALAGDGTVWAWGDNAAGQLGDGTLIGTSTPVQVSGLAGVVAVGAGEAHSVAILGDGTVRAWGSNVSGQLGNGTFVDSSLPVTVSNLTDVVGGSVGSNHNIAVRTDGTVWAWGNNASGQLGDGTTASSAIPIKIPLVLGDGIPDAFAFQSQTGATVNSLVPSNTVIISGVAGPSRIAIDGCDSSQCEYSINGGAWTGVPGLVANGDRVQARIMSAGYATQAHLTLSIGGIVRTFTVSTIGSPGALQFSAPTYSVAEGVATVTLSVTRSGGSTGAASVHYATSDGSATAGSDYTAASGTLSWAAGDVAAKTIAIPIANDTIAEANETFSVTLTNPVGATLGTPNPATVTILDKSSTVQFNPAVLSVNEGNNAVLTVSRTGSSVGAVTVAYATANGTALSGGDYLATSGTLSWADGDGTDKTITIPIVNDSVIEPNETLTVTLSAPVGAALGSAKSATVTIQDNEAANTLQFNPATAGVSEGGGSVSLSVTRTGSSTGAASATWSTADGSAKAGLDYTAQSGTLTWAAGDASAKTITIPILEDTLVEAAETFTINLTTAVGATLGTAKVATVTIADNESGAGTLQLAVDAYSVKENAASITLGVTRQGGATGAVSVQYATANGSATAGADYTAKSGTLTWASGDAATKTIVVSLLNDSATEGTETFTVTLGSPTGGAVLGAPASATVSIIDDETPATVGLSFAARKYTVAENAGTIILSVTRDAANAVDAASVSYATSNGSAMSGTDYVAQSGSLSWSAGDSTTRSIVVPIVNDSVAEATESFSVTLSNAAGNSLGATPVATVTILDDDEIFPPLVIPAGWSIPAGADAGWATAYDQYQAGIASLRSGSIGDNQKAQVEVTQNFQNGMVSFALKTSSQAGADYLRFYIDGEKKGEWSGIQTTWTTVSYPLAAGTHTLRWSYEKNASLIGGSDAAWIDSLTLPALQ